MSLKTAISRKLDSGQLRDVAEHGADAGFPGFCYYYETADFYRKHKAEIVCLVESTASDFGTDPCIMVAAFRCLNSSFSPAECARVLYGTRRTWPQDGEMIANALAWFALEETSRAIVEH